MSRTKKVRQTHKLIKSLSLSILLHPGITDLPKQRVFCLAQAMFCVKKKQTITKTKIRRFHLFIYPYICVCVSVCVCVLVAQSCPTLCDLMDCNSPGFSRHGIFQAKISEWVAISFSNIHLYLQFWIS